MKRIKLSQLSKEVQARIKEELSTRVIKASENEFSVGRMQLLSSLSRYATDTLNQAIKEYSKAKGYNGLGVNNVLEMDIAATQDGPRQFVANIMFVVSDEAKGIVPGINTEFAKAIQYNKIPNIPLKGVDLSLEGLPFPLEIKTNYHTLTEGTPPGFNSARRNMAPRYNVS